MLTEPQELDDYFYMLDMKDKYTKQPSILEVSKAFSDCRDIAIRVYLIDKPNKTDNIMMQAVIDVGSYYKPFRDAKRFLALTNDVKEDNKIDIDTVKRIQIEDCHDFGKTRTISKRTYASCPFHKDNTPSFIIYRDSNTWHCFSCNKGGSVIDFIMELHGKSFIDAVKFLQG